MKYVFRLGFALVPFLFFVSRTAYPSTAMAETAASHASKASRAPAQIKPAGLDRFALPKDFSTLAPSKASRTAASDFRAAAPPVGSGIGFSGPLLRFGAGR
jgi:hypothetical protein